MLVLITAKVLAQNTTSSENGTLKPPSLMAASQPQVGGAMLEFPRGRFQESDPPSFFKWATLQKSDSQTLKIYSTNEREEFESAHLIAKFDFSGDVQNFTWNHGDLATGNYTWAIETYELKKPKPTFIDRAKFKIEQLKFFDFKSDRIGAVLGFSRGTSEVATSTSNLKYDVTPVFYGLMYSGNHKVTNLFSTQLMANDFLLQGKSYREIYFLFDYLYPMNKPQEKFKFYFGPTFRLLSLPILYSTNTTTAQQADVVVLNPGATLVVQNNFDNHITLYSKLNVETPTLGTENIRMSLESTNIEVKSGLLYGLIWPIGFSGEIMYRYEPLKIKIGSETIESTRKELGVMATLVYAF
ncbi:MAG: hypothetical protein ABL927_00965 [Bdellovibrionales bacterium]